MYMGFLALGVHSDWEYGTECRTQTAGARRQARSALRCTALCWESDFTVLAQPRRTLGLRTMASITLISPPPSRAREPQEWT
jgi:hypothetical protein